jgi:hypothetical protein
MYWVIIVIQNASLVPKMVVIHAYAIKDTGIHHVILSALEEQPNPVQDMGHVIIQVSKCGALNVIVVYALVKSPNRTDKNVLQV